MSNHPKLIKIPGTFLDAIERLLQTAPPPKTEQEQRAREESLRTVKRVRKRPVKAAGAKAGKAARKNPRKAEKKAASKVTRPFLSTLERA